MRTKGNSIDEILDAAAPDHRAALEKLRRQIRAAAPGAVETISYGLPAFRLDGRALVAFGDAAGHCAFYPMSARTIAEHARELAGFDTSKGTIRFQPKKPLPAALLRKLVKARVAENGAKGPVRGAPAATAKSSPTRSQPSRSDPAVDAFLLGLVHPMKKEIEATRRAILGASPTIGEGIQWNAPSFRTKDWFATFFLRTRDEVQLIFHTGAKKTKHAQTGLAIPDPKGLLRWLAKDRCIVKPGAGKEPAANRAPLVAIVRAWIRQL
jgi:uncharacterized protein YdhG (YjbR/CyaY superfamily)